MLALVTAKDSTQARSGLLSIELEPLPDLPASKPSILAAQFTHARWPLSDKIDIDGDVCHEKEHHDITHSVTSFRVQHKACEAHQAVSHHE